MLQQSASSKTVQTNRLPPEPIIHSLCRRKERGTHQERGGRHFRTGRNNEGPRYTRVASSMHKGLNRGNGEHPRDGICSLAEQHIANALEGQCIRCPSGDPHDCAQKSHSLLDEHDMAIAHGIDGGHGEGSPHVFCISGGATRLLAGTWRSVRHRRADSGLALRRPIRERVVEHYHGWHVNQEKIRQRCQARWRTNACGAFGWSSRRGARP